MNWVILIIVSLLSFVLVAFLVSVAARILSAIPRPGIRKWIVICIGLFVSFHVALFAVLAIVIPKGLDFDVAQKAISGNYQSLPTITLLFCVPVVIGTLALIGLLLYGFLPERGLPYRPRAASWNQIRMLKIGGLLLVGLVLAIVVQDVEFRWRLSKIETNADTLAASMRPAAVPDVRNAAKHYQLVVAAMDKLDSNIEPDQAEHVEHVLREGGPVDAETIQYFARFQTVFDELRLAARCDMCCYDDSFAPLEVLGGIHTNSSVSSAMAQLSKFAMLETCKDQPNDAIECIRIMRQWENHLQKDPRNVESEFFFWTEREIRDIVQHLIAHSKSLPLDQMKSIIAVQLSIDVTHESAVKWNAALKQKTLASVFNGRVYNRPEFRQERFLASDSWYGSLGRFFLRFHLARDDMMSVENQFRCLETPYDRNTWAGHSGEDVWPRGQIAALISWIGISRWYFDEAESWRRLSNIGIAAALYHDEHNAWPSALEQLTPKYFPAVPRDPHNDAPYHARITEDGMIVFANEELKYLEKAENDGKLWQEVSETSAPIFLLGDALRKANATSNANAQ